MIDMIVACRPEAGQAISHRLRRGGPVYAGFYLFPRSGLTTHPVDPVNPVG